MVSLQEVLDKCPNNECYLLKDIYLAPLVINRPCKIYGNGAVVLCREDANIQVKSENVEFNDLCIEPDNRETCATPLIQCRNDTIFNNVIVRGMIDNGTSINDDKDLPSVLDLGDFRSEMENTFFMDLTVGEDCILSCTTQSIKITPNRLKMGKNIITLRTTKVRNDVIIYTKLLLTGVATREIVVRGRALNTADIHNESDLTRYDGSESALKESIRINALPPNIKENKLAVLKKGQRFLINGSNSEVKLQLAYENKAKQFDVDGYVFLLDETGKAGKDNNLIFWGNKSSEDGSVIMTDDGAESFFSISLDKVSDSIKKIAVCYSIYGDNASETFRYVIQPYIRIFVDGIENERYYMSDLQNEKTIVAVELYLHKGCWKLSCIGSGYRNGLKKLCEEYGLEVTD